MVYQKISAIGRLSEILFDVITNKIMWLDHLAKSLYLNKIFGDCVIYLRYIIFVYETIEKTSSLKIKKWKKIIFLNIIFLTLKEQ